MPRLLVVLDLNDTLAKKEWNSDFTIVTWTPYEKIDQLWNLVRNGDIDIALWSGAWRNTVDSFVSQCVPNDITLLASWCRDEAIEDTEFPDIRPPQNRNIAIIKDLDIMWNKFPQYNRTNTIIFDDSEKKVRRQKNNAWIVPKNSNDLGPILDIINEILETDMSVLQYIELKRTLINPSIIATDPIPAIVE